MIASSPAGTRQPAHTLGRWGPSIAVSFALLAMALLMAACNGGVPVHTSQPRSIRPGPSVSSVPTSVSTTTAAPPTTTDPGLLPQTTEEPSTGTALQAQMHTLFQAIVDGSLDEALPLFFPESAYLQMKTGVISDPAGDYTDRLIAFYELDIAAYHTLLNGQGPGATLIDVLVEPAYAAWIPPGTCENLIGYWHIPGIRLVYKVGSVEYSFAVASLISWRGTWYVVHLGPNPRPSNVGTVDQPETGAGTPGPPGGC